MLSLYLKWSSWPGWMWQVPPLEQGKLMQALMGISQFWPWSREKRKQMNYWILDVFPSRDNFTIQTKTGRLTDAFKSLRSSCVSVQGLHPLKDPAFVVFESFRETSLTSSAGLAFGAFPGCVTRCLRHDFCRPGPQKWRTTPRDVAIFSLSYFFFGRAKNLGICEATKDRSGASSRNREEKECFARCCDVTGLQMLLWRIQNLNQNPAQDHIPLPPSWQSNSGHLLIHEYFSSV